MDPKVREAKRDRRFWKVLLKERDQEYGTTPFRGFNVFPDTLYDQPDDDFDTFSYNSHGTKYYEVEGGSYHLFRTWLGALRFILRCRYWGKNMVVVKAVVPKGAKYMSGTYNGILSVAVKKVIYKF